MRIPKKIENKLKKITNNHPSLISRWKGQGLALKETKKNFSFITVFCRPEHENSGKKKKKKKKQTKQNKTHTHTHHHGFISSRNESGQAEKEEKKISCLKPISPNSSLRIPRKVAKKFKKFKNIILASFQAETGRDWPKKKEKKFLVRNYFYPTRA